MQLGLLAVESVVIPQIRASNGSEDPFTSPWRDVDSAQPAAARVMLGRFLDGLAAVYAGTCKNPPCDKDMRSSVPFKISRTDPIGAGCACCRRLFDEEDSEGVVSEILVVPRLTSGHSGGHALMFCSGTPLSAEEARFLHTAAGLYFAQQTIWESGQREEPAAALRPREIECVRWAVTGKTLGEIAEIMGLSYRTVRFHLDSARARYGFSTNQQLFVQAAKDYGLDPEGDRAVSDAPARREKSRPDTRAAMGRMQPIWAERRDPRDRRSEDRRRADLPQLPFPDRRAAADRRKGQERRAIVQAPSETAEQLLTPEEIRALLN